MRKTLVLFGAVLLLTAPAVYAQAPDTTTVCKIQDGTYGVGSHVFIDSVLVTALDLKPSTYGFWIEEREPCASYPNREYSGVLVYMSYARPDTIEGVGVEPGDLVSVRGGVEEYPDAGPSVTEVTNPPDAYAPAVHIIQKSYGMPPTVKRTVHDFGTVAEDSANCEKWEGVWCQVDTVVCTEWLAPLEYAEWQVVEMEDYTGLPKTTDSLRIDDKLVVPSLAKASPGDTLKTIYGVFSYEYGNYKLWPRSNEDVVYLSAPPAPNLLQAYSRDGTHVIAVFDRDVSEESAADPENFELVTPSVTASARISTRPTEVLVTHEALAQHGLADQLTARDIENEFGRAMPEAQSVPFRIGVAQVTLVQTPLAGDDSTFVSQVVGEQVTVGGIVTGGSDEFGGFFLGTPEGKEYSGVYVFDSSNNRSVGDSVIVSAEVSEYYGFTELYLPDYVSPKILGGHGAINPTVVDPSVLTTPSPNDTAEAWEGCLVKLEDVEVATWANQYGEWYVHRGTDSVHVDDRAGYEYMPVVGDSLDLTGIVDYAYSIWTMQPRDTSDIYVFFFGAVEDGTLPLHVVKLKNFPNPFNPKTTIEFGIASAVGVRLEVFDVSGRLVRTLVDEANMRTGTYRVLWNGNDSNGHAVAAGVYYCRLEAGDRVEKTKLVLVK